MVDDDPKVANGASGGSKAYYDEPSATANELSENCGRQGFLARMWKKTWRLWAALLCFLMIPVMIWLLLDFFSGNGGTHIRVGAILAPIYLLYIGVKLLVGFVDDLSGDNQKGLVVKVFPTSLKTNIRHFYYGRTLKRHRVAWPNLFLSYRTNAGQRHLRHHLSCCGERWGRADERHVARVCEGVLHARH